MLASLKPRLLEETKNHEGIRLVDEPFTAIKQSIGLPKGKRDSVAYRIAPDDVKNSLIKPSDFNFLSPKDSEKYSWKMDDKKYHKKFKGNLNNDLRKENNKRFRLY